MRLFGSLWLLSDSLTDFEASGYKGGFFSTPLVTDGQFEWTSPFLTQKDWASEDDEWGCFKTSFSSVSPSLHFPPCMRKRNAELTDFYTPTISKWRNSFHRSSEPDRCKQDHHPKNTLWSHLCVLHPGKAPVEDISLKTEIMLWSRVLVSDVSRQPWSGDTLHWGTEVNFLATILSLPTIPRENDHIFFPIVSCSF